MTEPEYRTNPARANQPEQKPRRLLLFGLGYTGAAIAALAVERGWTVIATSRAPERLRPPPSVEVLRFEAAGAHLDGVSHILETAPPDQAGDPALASFSPAQTGERRERWAE